MEVFRYMVFRRNASSVSYKWCWILHWGWLLLCQAFIRHMSTKRRYPKRSRIQLLDCFILSLWFK